MRVGALLLLAAVELGGAFGSASAEVHSIGANSMTVDLSVEVTVSAQAVVAHLSIAEEPTQVVSLIDRGGGVFGIRTELEPRNYIVVFEVIGPESSLSPPRTMTELGAELSPDEDSPARPPADQSDPETSQLGWLALALAAASLSALAFWALAGDDEGKEGAPVTEEE